MPLDEVLYPVNLRVGGRRCLVVGGGRVALAKVDGLTEAGAVVEVIAPDVVAELDARTDITVHRRRYRTGDAGNYWLVVAATGCPEVNGEVYRDGEPLGCGSTAPTTRSVARSPFPAGCAEGR